MQRAVSVPHYAEDENETYIGKLFKKGNINKAWKQRYFKINRFKQTMRYYKDESHINMNGKEKGIIDLTEINKVQVISTQEIDFKELPKYVQVNGNVKSDKQYSFQLVSSGRTYTLATQSQSELLEWLKYLQLSIYGEIIHQGWLKKQGAVNKSWKKKYFVLNRYQQMKYYDDDKRTHLLGFIDCTKIKRVGNGKIYSNELQYTLELKEQRKYILAAQDNKERGKWIELINLMRKKEWQPVNYSNDNEHKDYFDDGIDMEPLLRITSTRTFGELYGRQFRKTVVEEYKNNLGSIDESKDMDNYQVTKKQLAIVKYYHDNYYGKNGMYIKMMNHFKICAKTRRNCDVHVMYMRNFDHIFWNAQTEIGDNYLV